MAIPRSPAFGPGMATPARENLEDLDDLEGSQGHHATPPEDPEAELARLRQELRQAQETVAALQRAASVTPAPMPEFVHEPKVNMPEKFDGKLSEYSTFISQCLLIFSMCPRLYATDIQKIFFVISLCLLYLSLSCHILSQFGGPHAKKRGNVMVQASFSS